MKKLVLIIDGNKQEISEIEAFEVSYGVYEEADIVIVINTNQKEVIAEGVLRPSSQGIYKDKLEDTKLENTLYMSQYEQLRDAFRSKIISEVSEDYAFIEKMSLSTKAYEEPYIIEAIEELVESEKELTRNGFIKIIKSPKIEFIKEGYLKIVEEVDVYKQRIKIEDAKTGEIK